MSRATVPLKRRPSRTPATEPFIPERFAAAVDEHLVFNFASVPAWPLVLGVFGRPGDGKSFQLRTHLRRRGVTPVSINAADLESERAGAPGKLVLDVYQDAGHRIDESEPAALVVDDFDTTVGEWDDSTTTVNHQQVLAQLMHLADSPMEASGKRLRRVPVFISGNDLSKVYPPLRRPGRMRTFPWEPSAEERRAIVTSVFADVFEEPEVTQLLAAAPTAPVAFFSDLLVEITASVCRDDVIAKARAINELIRPGDRTREELEARMSEQRMPIDEVIALAERLLSERALATMSHLGK